MASTEALTRRPLRPADIPDLEALVAEAGWNQTARDWQRMLALGSGRGFATPAGRVVASAVTMPYGGSLGWIGMVLVAGAWRRRGLATDLLADCVSDLRGRGLVPGLDATPAGEEVYRKLGFDGDLTVTRWRRAETPPAALADAEEVTVADINWIADLDAAALGAPRRELLADFLAAEGTAGWKSGEDGFLLHRPGRTARQLGPFCAADDAVAERLLSAAIAALPGALLIDVPDRHAGLVRILESAGFAAERPFRRMYLGAGGPIGEPRLLRALAGPEIG